MRTKHNRYSNLLLFAFVVGWAGIVPAFLSSLASGGTTSSLDEVLDQWAAALGGRDRLASIGTMHSHARAELFGLEGSLEEWFTADGKHRLDLDLSGVYTMTVVTTQQHSWYSEQKGAAVEQEGKDLEDEVRDVFLGTWSHLLPERMAGEVDLLATEHKTGEIAVRISPTAGTPVTVFLDDETHLPKRSKSTDDTGETLITTFSKWLSYEGILVATHVVMSTGSPENDVVVELSDVRFNEVPPAAAFEKPESAFDEVQFVNGESVSHIPLDIDGVHLFLQAHINESPPLWFILDTGASVTIFDRTTAVDLGFYLTGEVLGDGVGEEKVEVSFVQDISLCIPGVRLPEQTAAVVDLRELEAGFGREVHGILGYDFISRFVVEIDYQNSQLRLYDRERWEYGGNGAEVPIRFVDKKPICDGSITLPNGTLLDCTIRFDTGSGTTIRFNRPFTEEHDLISALPKTFESRGGSGLGGITRDCLGRIAAMRICDLEFEAPNCAFSRDEKGISADPSHACKVGGKFLERCTVILDYRGERIFLEPNDTFGAPFPGEMCGLTVRSGGRGDWHRLTVVDVIAGSPADEADIEVDDVIVSVDRKPATTVHLRDLKQMFSEQGRQIELEFERDGTLFQRTLRMEPIL
jgi:hypothetical protein